jgi:enoyl-CoA hydratase/carnithine racemase
MDEIVAERSGSILRVELNRPAKKNAMTSAMYASLAKVFEDAGKDERTRVVLWYGAGIRSLLATISKIFSSIPRVQGNPRKLR